MPYNLKDIQFAGKYDCEKASAPYSTAITTSVGIFKLVLTSNGKRLKRTKAMVRVRGSIYQLSEIDKTCEGIISELDAGTYTGKKTVTLK